MKRLLCLIGFLSVSTAALAEGPLYQHSNAIDQQEFEQIYSDIRNPHIANETVANATMSFVHASTATFDVGTVGKSSTNACGYIIGSVVQISSFVVTTTTSTTTTKYAKTTLTRQITPKCASDIIRLSSTVSLTNSSISTCDCSVTIYRNPDGAFSDMSPNTSGSIYFGDGGSAIQIEGTFPLQFYDLPATTSATTYTVMVKIAAGSGTCTVSGNSANKGGSRLIVEEIAE